MLLDLVKGELDCPRYVVFLPPPGPRTVYQKLKAGASRAVSPRDWFKDRVLMFVVCPCCWTAVDCGPGHQGYELKVRKDRSPGLASLCAAPADVVSRRGCRCRGRRSSSTRRPLR
jgi:hypothetical protein